MTVILGIDTATSGCSAAVIRETACLAASRARMARGQSEALMPMIDDVVRRAGIVFADIDAIAVTRGPGAFTGLRIGLAAARALALAIDKPCLGIGTFDALFAEAAERGLVEGKDALIVAVDSKRDELFIAVFDAGGAPVRAPAALRADAVAACLTGLKKIAVVGDAGVSIEEELRSTFEVTHHREIALPDPAVVARLGLATLNAPGNAPAVPLYLRPPDVSLPKK